MKTFPPELLEIFKDMAGEARDDLDKLDQALINGDAISIRMALSHARVPLNIAAEYLEEADAEAELRAKIAEHIAALATT